MTIKLGVVMDSIQTIHYQKDSTLALLWEAAARGWTLYYFEQQDLFLRDGKALGNSRLLNVLHDSKRWFELASYQRMALSELDIILLRKDPPFDLEYIYTTYILELAEQTGVRVMNKPQSLRDANEKCYTAWFPALCPPTLITRDMQLLREFLQEHNDIICKPLDKMGGASVFRVHAADLNQRVIFETLTQHGHCFMMAQQFIPEIKAGDKRILLINGTPVPYSLARIPAIGELRGNLAAGATGIAKRLTQHELELCEVIAPALRKKGLLFVGIDVIGNYLTEINVTSPTGVRELDEQCGLNVSKMVWDMFWDISYQKMTN